MTAHTKLRMTADEFIPWAMSQPKRYELVGGEVVAMSPERVGHADTKGNVYAALREAIKAAGVPCRAYPDGVSVRIDARTVYEPDALVRCGEPPDRNVIEINDPIILVEVVSPSSQSVDAGAKLADYFRLPSMRHYLIVKDENQTAIHHFRAADDRIETRIVRSGPLAMDPPGIEVGVESFFAG
ncbi:MAG TPA: Uma2 family endonuclease [Beijerinckiaceae bacterium]|jgi:Uma2 family endonuclease